MTVTVTAIARLQSLSDATNYIRLTLGEPTINVELTDDQLKQCVYDAHKLFQRYNVREGTFEETIKFKLKAGQTSYPMPDNIAEVTHFLGSNNGDINQPFTNDHLMLMETGILPSMTKQMQGNSVGLELTGYDIATKYLELFKQYFSKTYAVAYHYLRRELVVTPTPAMDIQGLLVVWKSETLTNTVDHNDMKKLMVAKAKQAWGRVLGKYSLTLPGGGTVDGAALISEGMEQEQQTIERLDEESEGGALGFYIG